MQRLILFIFVFISLPISLAAHGTTPHGDLIIRMTANGFEPKQITVTSGDEVLFINNDDTNRWPASNFHPTHSIYPEFDPLRGIEPGGSWKMKFLNTGTWRMHDHLFPHFTGTITVLENPDAISTTSPEVQENFWSRLKNFFLKIFSRDKKVTSIPLDEHGKAHLKGQELFKKYGAKGLSKCTTEAAFGCYHGFTETIFDGNSEKEYVNNILEIEKSCLTLGSPGSGPNASCIHGIGHGVVTYREHDMNKSLKDCDVLGEEIRTYCNDGVFMELSISAPGNFYIKDDPVYPCNSVADKYKYACIRSQVKVMSGKFGMNTASIFNVCKKTKNSTIVSGCRDSLGLYIAQDGKSDPKKIVRDCREIIDEEAVAYCMSAAAGELVFQDYEGWQKNVTTICQSLDGNYRALCEQKVETIKKDYNR